LKASCVSIIFETWLFWPLMAIIILGGAYLRVRSWQADFWINRKIVERIEQRRKSD